MEGENLLALIIIITVIAHLPAIIMTIVGFAIRQKNPKAAKILFIISGIYLIIGLGICGSMFMN